MPVLLLAWIYREGVQRRADAVRRTNPTRHIAFATGLTLFLLSVEWPFARWAHELFFVHQIGIMVARIIAPMLIVIAHPAGLLIAGLPRRARSLLLRPSLSDRRLRAAWRLFGSAPATMIAYVAALYLWEIPAAQAAAVKTPLIGLAMHFSLLFAGLLFWGRIFARRPAPHGVSHGARLMMLWIAILTQLPLGAYLTIKRGILYPAYATGEALPGMSALADEARGGFFIWVPSAFLSLLALIVVVDMLGRHETRLDEKRRRWSPSNSAILLYPETARALREMVRGKNRRMAIGMAAFGLAIFAAVWGMTSSAHRLSRRENLRLYELSKQ
jgi:putative membrane protein